VGLCIIWTQDSRLDCGLNYGLAWTGVTIHWTGLLDWTTGPDYYYTQMMQNATFSLFSVGEKLIMFIQPTSLLNFLP